MNKRYSVGILSTHAVQYHTPYYRMISLNPEVRVKVFFCHNQSAKDNARSGFGVPFTWDIPLLDGYNYRFLKNMSRHPSVDSFFGCNTPEIGRIISHEHFDAFIVFGWHVYSYWQAIFSCWRCRVPVIIRGDSQLSACKSAAKKIAKYPFYRWFIPRFDAYLAVGTRSSEYYRHYGAKESKIFFSPHTVDNEYFDAQHRLLESKRLALRKLWGIPDDSAVLLFAGKVIPKKRPHDFLQAVRLARDKIPQLFGLVVGDGILRNELESISHKYNLPVKYTGFINQTLMPAAYAISDVLVLPSDARETWGLVVNEAMASSLPAIVSDEVGCVPDLILQGKTGEVFKCGDVIGLARACQRVLSDRMKLKEMSAAARRHIEQYSIKNAVCGTISAISAAFRE